MYKIIKKSYNFSASTYNKRFSHIQNIKFTTILDKYDSFITDNSAVLDLGCGTGLFGTFIKSRFGCFPRIWGIDFAEKMLDLAAEAGYKVTLGDISSLPYRDNMFDCLVSFTVLRVTREIDEEQVFSEIRRVVKSEGLIVLTILKDQADTLWEERINSHFTLETALECGQDWGYICRNRK